MPLDVTPTAGRRCVLVAAILVLFLAAALSTGCGQKGPLVLPDQSTSGEPPGGAEDDEDEQDSDGDARNASANGANDANGGNDDR